MLTSTDAYSYTTRTQHKKQMIVVVDYAFWPVGVQRLPMKRLQRLLAYAETASLCGLQISTLLHRCRHCRYQSILKLLSLLKTLDVCNQFRNQPVWMARKACDAVGLTVSCSMAGFGTVYCVQTNFLGQADSCAQTTLSSMSGHASSHQRQMCAPERILALSTAYSFLNC